MAASSSPAAAEGGRGTCGGSRPSPRRRRQPGEDHGVRPAPGKGQGGPNTPASRSRAGRRWPPPAAMLALGLGRGRRHRHQAAPVTGVSRGQRWPHRVSTARGPRPLQSTMAAEKEPGWGPEFKSCPQTQRLCVCMPRVPVEDIGTGCPSVCATQQAETSRNQCLGSGFRSSLSGPEVRQRTTAAGALQPVTRKQKRSNRK